MMDDRMDMNPLSRFGRRAWRGKRLPGPTLDDAGIYSGGLSGAARGARGNIAAHPYLYGAGAGAAGLGAAGYGAYQYFGDDEYDDPRMDMMDDRMDMAIPGVDAARRFGRRVWRGKRLPAPDDAGPLYSGGMSGAIRDPRGTIRGQANRLADSRVGRGVGAANTAVGQGVANHPYLYGAGAAGLGGLGVGYGAGIYTSDDFLGRDDDRMDMASGSKGAIFKKIARAAGIGAAGAAGVAGGVALSQYDGRNARSADDDDMPEGRTDMMGSRSRKDMDSLIDRDKVLQQAIGLNPSANYAGMNTREILNVLYKNDPEAGSMSTERLRSRLDMEAGKQGNAQTYVQKGSSNENQMASTLDGGSLALNLRKMMSNQN